MQEAGLRISDGILHFRGHEPSSLVTVKYKLLHRLPTHVLEAGYLIRTVQELLGHKDVKTTMIYTHVLNHRPPSVRSPVDTL